MRPRAVDWLVCPVCGEDLEVRDVTAERVAVSDGVVTSACTVCRAPDPADRRSAPGVEMCGSCYALEVAGGFLVCSKDHVFPIRAGVPRLLLADLQESTDARSIRESFSRQWESYDYEAEDRTWGQTIDERRADFLRMVDESPDALPGKRVLDAGCGNGLLSKAMSEFGCEVLAADISSIVEDAFAHLRERGSDGVHFVQADLMAHPFRPAAFDIVFCAGVLIVTPDSRRTLDHIARAVAPGGKIFVWVYWRESGLKYRVKTSLRTVVARLPLFMRRAVAAGFVPQAMLRQYVRRLVRPSEPGEQLKWRERFLVQHDFFTPRYRWEHTPDEVREWYRELGFVDAKVTEVVPAGFGMLARRPADDAHDLASVRSAARTAPS